MHFWFNIKSGKRIWMFDICSMKTSVFPDSFFDSNNIDTADNLDRLLPPGGAAIAVSKAREKKEKNEEINKDNKDRDKDNEMNDSNSENLKKANENPYDTNVKIELKKENEKEKGKEKGKDNERDNEKEVGKEKEKGDGISQNDVCDELGSTVETQKGSYLRLAGTGAIELLFKFRIRTI